MIVRSGMPLNNVLRIPIPRLTIDCHVYVCPEIQYVSRPSAFGMRFRHMDMGNDQRRISEQKAVSPRQRQPRFHRREP